jgi:hypothetical protein
MSVTYCRDCDHVHSLTRGEDPWNWRCMEVPIAPGFGFVDPEFSPNPPYEKCSRVNTNGECQHFKPKPEPNPEYTPQRWKR